MSGEINYIKKIGYLLAESCREQGSKGMGTPADAKIVKEVPDHEPCRLGRNLLATIPFTIRCEKIAAPFTSRPQVFPQDVYHLGDDGE